MQQQLSPKLTGYLMAPHEWLRIGAYKVLGKRYHYHIGDLGVESAEPLTRRQQLFCLFMPLGVGMAVTLVVAGLWMLSGWLGQYPPKLPDYLWLAPWWHHGLHLLWLALLSYTVLFSSYDILSAYYSTRQQPPHHEPE